MDDATLKNLDTQHRFYLENDDLMILEKKIKVEIEKELGFKKITEVADY